MFAPALPRLAGAAAVSDWQQWRGPDRNGISKETGLLKSWPASGPAAEWTMNGLGAGYGSMAVAGDRIYVQGVSGSTSCVFAVDRKTGKIAWKSDLGRTLDHDRGPGPRGTPTLDGERLYVLSENGDLAALKAADGSSIWKLNMLQQFGGDNPNWLISESPLIDGNRVIVTPGGRDASIVALDKTSGKTVWTSKGLSDRAGYASCIVADVAGVRTIMNLTSRAGVGVRASDGKPMWSYEEAANRTANCTTPIYSDNKVFYTSAYGTGCGLLALTPSGEDIKAQQVYFSRDMQNHHGGVVLVGGYLYGFSNAILTCLEFATGKVMWRDRSVGKGSVIYAEGNLYLHGEGHVVGLAAASPERYIERGRFTIQDSGFPSWAHPVISSGRLYIRDQGTLTAYRIQA
jgi:outer membrane protein assembly factor BamB